MKNSANIGGGIYVANQQLTVQASNFKENMALVGGGSIGSNTQSKCSESLYSYFS